MLSAPLRRITVATVLGASALSTTAAPSAAIPPGSSAGCEDRILVLTAMPLELHPLLAEATLDPSETVHVEHRTFYLGRLGGTPVAMAMTGIGLVNAEQAAAAAFEHFHCQFAGVVFAGVAGSRRSIGDVVIPSRWTRDGGASWIAADPAMVRTARQVAAGEVRLSGEVPVGDAACLCPGVETVSTPIQLEHRPRIFVGGDGSSDDNFGGRALPCVPGGGDVFGCEPCLAPGSTAADAIRFASQAPSYADPGFLGDLLQPPAETTTTLDAQDMESAAVAAVARRRGVPFVAIRSVSDGQGDPLDLPGFPWQFLAYRQLAGDNAAAVTIAFLERWRATRPARLAVGPEPNGPL